MTVDLTPVVQYVAAAALAAVTAIIPLAATWLQKHLAFLKDRQLSDALVAAATRGAGLAYTQLLAAGEAAARPNVQNAAVSAGLEYVLNSFPDFIARNGITPDHVASMIAGELGKLLAADPTVGPSVTPAAAPVADPAPVPAPSAPVAQSGGTIAAVLGVLVLAGGLLAGCTAAQEAQVNTALRSPAGQLFCAVQTNGGAQVVVALLNAEATALAPGAAPIAVLATGAAKTVVDSACAQAGGVPVSPPADPNAVQTVAVTVPPGTPSAPLIPAKGAAPAIVAPPAPVVVPGSVSIP